MIEPRLALGLVLFGLGVALAVGLLLRNRAITRTARNANRSITQIRTDVVRSTSKLVETRTGNGLQRRLEQSGSQLRSGEWLLAVIAVTGLAVVIAFLLGNVIGTVLIGLIVPAIAVALLNRNVARRQQAFADQLPDLLQNLSSALRSGQSLPQAVASIAPDLDAPAGEELRRVAVENRIGRDLITSFEDLARRMDSVDFDWVVRAIHINHHTGGDLPNILRRLDRTIRARNHVAGAVRSLSAEGRISGVVLTILPIVLLVAVQFLNPEFLLPLFQTSLGRVMLAVAALQLCVGAIWLSRLSKFRF